jgi:hypothetical protein
MDFFMASTQSEKEKRKKKKRNKSNFKPNHVKPPYMRHLERKRTPR